MLGDLDGIGFGWLGERHALQQSGIHDGAIWVLPLTDSFSAVYALREGEIITCGYTQ